MIDLELTPAERRAYEDALADVHRRVRSTLELLDRDEKSLGVLGGSIAGGGVTIDALAPVSRTLNVKLVDERRRLRVEPDSPADGAVHADNFIRAEYGVWVPVLDRWVDCPVFHGPITKVERAGGEATIEAQGKESLMLDPHLAGQGYTIRRKTRTDDAIEKVARRAGERRFALPDLGSRIPRGRVVGPEAQPWLVIRGGEVNAKGKELPGLIERGGGDYLPWYDGRGYLTARRRGANPVYTFRSGEGGTILGEPTVKYDVLEFRNAVRVTGGRRKKKPRGRAFVTLPASHPLSPRSLARNGEPRYLVEAFESEGLKTDRACERRGKAILERAARQGVTVEFETLPVPFLEELDEIAVRLDEFATTMPLERATIPLTATDAMSVGFTKRPGR